MKRILSSMLAVAVLLFSACGDDDDASPKSQFKFEEEDAVTLKDANLYLVYEDEDGDGHIYRDYFITDGTYVDGDGWSLEDYTNATYVMAVELGVPVEDETLSDGKYPMYASFSDAPESSRISWISFETSGGVYYEIPNGSMGDDDIEISGDYDDGDKMTIKFNGTLTHYGDENVAADGKVYFKGEVQDVRPVSLPRQAGRGGMK